MIHVEAGGASLYGVSGRNVRLEMHVVDGLLHQGPGIMPALYGTAGGPRVVVMDKAVAGLYGEEIRTQLTRFGFVWREMICSRDTDADDFESEMRAYVREMGVLRAGICVIAFGGGWTYDCVTNAVKNYPYGLPWAFVSTTLAGCGEAARDLGRAVREKDNAQAVGRRVPKRIYLDVGFLRTLSNEHILKGAMVWSAPDAGSSPLLRLLAETGEESFGERLAAPRGRALLVKAIRDMVEHEPEGVS